MGVVIISKMYMINLWFSKEVFTENDFHNERKLIKHSANKVVESTETSSSPILGL